MSLRSRLLIAIGVIALVALAIADVVTYSSLESFLYQRVDQQLEASHVGIEGRINSGGLLSCFAIPGQSVPAGGDAGGSGIDPKSEPPSNAIQVQAVEVRKQSGGLVDSQSCAANVDGANYTPQIPHTVAGFSTAENGEQVVYFTAPASQAGGPAFRVRASILDNGDLLIVAQPLGDTGSTLHQLLLVE